MSASNITPDGEPSCHGVGSSVARGFASPAADEFSLPAGLPPPTVGRPRAEHFRSSRPSLSALVYLPGRALDLVATWIARSERRTRMMKFDDHLLRDIGTDRFQVEREWRKPFWRA